MSLEAADFGVHQIGCTCLDCTLEAWRMPDTSKQYRDAAKEIDTLRSLIDEQLMAMTNTPMSDMNYAGIAWAKKARRARQ